MLVHQEQPQKNIQKLRVKIKRFWFVSLKSVNKNEWDNKLVPFSLKNVFQNFKKFRFSNRKQKTHSSSFEWFS